MKKIVYLLIGLIVLLYFSNKVLKKVNFNSNYEVGQGIDSLHNVIVHYNGGVGNVEERNTVEGYNIGLKYQCVEFVKRYYFEYLNHKMPDSYGHAISFFDPTLKDGAINKQRNLTQYTNPSQLQPKVSDLIIMNKTTFNKYGHVAIVSKVDKNKIEIIQQNPGPFKPSRLAFNLEKNQEGKWQIENKKILGWLRKE